MFIKVEPKKVSLQIPESYYELLRIEDNDDLVFRFHYEVDQLDVIKKDFKYVRVSVLNTNAKQTQATTSLNQKTPKQLIDELLVLGTTARGISSSKTEQVVAQVLSDNSAYVNNEIITFVRKNDVGAKESLNTSTIKVESVSSIQRNNEIKPILQSKKLPAAKAPDVSVKNSLKSSILAGIDAGSILTDRTLASTTRGSLQGIPQIKTNYSEEETPSQLLFERVTNFQKAEVLQNTQQIRNNILVPVIVQEKNKELLISVDVTIPDELIRDENNLLLPVTIQFEALDSYKKQFTVYKRSLDVPSIVQTFITPNLAPRVYDGGFSTNYQVRLQIAQQDERAQAARIYKKPFNLTNSVSENYEFVNEISCTKAMGLVTTLVPFSGRIPMVYKVIPVGRDKSVGSNFRNIVVHPMQPDSYIKHVSVVAQTSLTGIAIEIREVPPDIVSVAVMRRDRTAREKQYTWVSDDILYVNQNSNADIYSVVDSNVVRYHIYEYCCLCYRKDGRTFHTGFTSIEYIPLTEDLVSLEIQDLQVDKAIDALDVKFRIVGKVAESNTDVVRKLLEAKNLSQYFQEELLNEKGKLESLLAYQVDRINLQSGLRETFGIITDSEFSDASNRVVNSVETLRIGYSYRYEVTAMLRDTQTLFPSTNKIGTDKNSKKTFSYSPFKYFHPIVFTEGNINSELSLAEHHAKSQFSFGNTGTVKRIDVNFAEDVATIVDANVRRLDRSSLIVTWKVVGPAKNVDYFVLSKEILGIKSVVQNVHSVDDKNLLSCIVKIPPQEHGQYHFSITPVFVDYSVGETVDTNTIIV